MSKESITNSLESLEIDLTVSQLDAISNLILSEIPEAEATTKILAGLDESKCDFFATKGSVNEALKYSVAVLQASSKQEREAMVTITTGVYHNTLVAAIRDSIVRTLAGE